MRAEVCRPRGPGWWRIALIAVATLVPSPLAAQSLTGTIVATVTDTQGGAVAGAAAQLTSPALIAGSTNARTNEKGQVRFAALPPGTYRLEISMPGFVKGGLSDLEVGGGDIVEPAIVLQPGFAEDVVVRAETSRMHDGKAGLGARFGPEDLKTIPTRRASMFDFIRAAPGISPSSPSSGTSTTVSAFGSGINTNGFMIDGTNFTCPCIGIARSEPGVDFIQEIQVQSAGASAEFGNVQGAVINVITRQGGNRFIYDAASFWQGDAFTSQPVLLPVPGAPGTATGYERVRYRDASTSLGGPIIHDRAWFFAGYQHLRDYDSQPGTYASQPRRYEQDKIAGKLTWRLADGMTLFNSIHDEFWENPQQATISRPYETTNNLSATVPAITFGHLTHVLSQQTVWDVRVGHFVHRDESRPNTGDLTAVSRIDAVTRMQSGGPMSFGNAQLGRTSAKATLSHYRTGLWRADHDARFGGQIETGGHDISVVIPTGQRFIDVGGRPSQKIERDPAHIGGQFVTAAAFVSDTLTFGDGLTISAGLRFEHNRAFHQDLNGVDLMGEETDEVYRGTGTVYAWNVFSPRLGVTKKLDADGRTILRGSYGRFYQGVLTAELDYVHPGSKATTRTVLATGAVIVDDPLTSLQVDPNTRDPYTDQYSAGVDRQLGGGLAVAVAYVYKNGVDSIGWTDVAGVYREESRTLANGMTTPVLRLDTAVTPPEARRFLLTNQDDYSVKYHGLVVAVEKRRSNRWQAFGSYTFSRAFGIQPINGATTAAEQTSTPGPGGGWGRDPNDLTNARGRLGNDRPHILRVMGSVEVPRTGILVAGNLQHFSGRPWASTTIVNLPQNAEQRILLEPRGSQRLSSQTLLDLRIARPFRIGRYGEIELLFDVLNALNESAGEAIATDTLTTSTIVRVPEYGRPNVFVDPRRAMLGIRFNVGRQ